MVPFGIVPLVLNRGVVLITLLPLFFYENFSVHLNAMWNNFAKIPGSLRSLWLNYIKRKKLKFIQASDYSIEPIAYLYLLKILLCAVCWLNLIFVYKYDND